MPHATGIESAPRAARALTRFLVRSGARVALRANGIVAAMVVFVFALDMDAVANLRVAVLQAVARNRLVGARWMLAALCVMFARLAVPRVALGVTGWIRSLPISPMARRRAMVVALAAAQLFPIAFFTLGALAAVLVYHAALDPAKLVSVPLMVVAASMLALPTQSFAGRGAALVALVFAVLARWPLIVGALAALYVADTVGGDRRRVSSSRPRSMTRAFARGSPAFQWVRFTLKTLPAMTIVGDYLLPGILTAFTALVAVRNPDLGPATVERTVRIGGMLGLIALAAGLATSVTRTRAAWPWARTLPWSSRQRVVADAAMHMAAMCPIVASLAFVNWRAAVTLVCVVPSLAIVAAAAIRAGPRRQASAAGEVVGFGAIAGTVISLFPWGSVFILLGAPFLLNAAARRDRRLIVSRFEELHHDVAGDPVWASAP